MHCANPPQYFFIFFVETEMDPSGDGHCDATALYLSESFWPVSASEEGRNNKKVKRKQQHIKERSNDKKKNRIAASQNEYQVVDINLKMEDMPKITKKRQHENPCLKWTVY